jgi:hypothetical protein
MLSGKFDDTLDKTCAINFHQSTNIPASLYFGNICCVTVGAFHFLLAQRHTHSNTCSISRSLFFFGVMSFSSLLLVLMI